MTLVDRVRIERKLLSYDFWLDYRGVTRKRRRNLRAELRDNLREAERHEDTSRALAAVGSARQLAFASSEVDAVRRPRWTVAGYVAMTLGVVMVYTWAIAAAAFLEGLQASGVKNTDVTGSMFPWLGSELTARVGDDALSVSTSLPWPIIVVPLLVLVLLARPWRAAHRPAAS